MDSITHIAIGAIIGDACAGKSLGKRAMLIGAVCQSIPDIDFIASFFLSPTDNLLAHRGFTHSLLFGFLATVAISFIVRRWRLWQELSLQKWMMLAGLEIFVHLLLDACNVYGVGWFEPFNHHRVSFNIIFVADPLYSIWLGISVVVLWLLPGNHYSRARWAKLGLIASSFYLCFSLVNKVFVNKTFEKTLQAQYIHSTRYFTTPTAFNNLLWYCVAENDSGYHIGYRSIFDTSEQVSLTYFPRQRWLLNAIEEDEELGNLLQFSKGYYTVERITDALVFSDLRFGRVAGWEKSETEFVFHYYLQRPGKNVLVVQRGRFAEWNIQTMKSLADRIKGE